MIELSKCPFCGKLTTVILTTAREIGDCKKADTCANVECESFTVICDYSDNGCGASSRYARSPEEAAEAWNRRA